MKGKLLVTMLNMLCLPLFSADPAADNLITDGGFEEIREVELTGGGHFFNNVKAGCDMGGGMLAKVPKNLDQLSGAKKFIVVEGKLGKEVHSGNYAVLFNGGFYLRYVLDAKTGDVFEVSYFAKGKSKVCVVFNLEDGGGKYFAAGLPKEYPVAVDDPDSWKQITHIITIKDEGVVKARMRFSAEGDVCVDDLVVRKLSGD